MDKINLGIIGLGYIGKVHLLNCLKINKVNLIGVSDISKKSLDFAKKMGVKKTYQNYKKFIKEKNLDAVIVSLPNHLHAICVKEVSEAGKHIFLEKPLARNIAEGKEIISLIKKHDICLMVGYPLRFSSQFSELKDDIFSGELGEIQTVQAINIGAGPFFHRAETGIPRPIPEWWFNPELSGGGALLDLGSHMINLLRWYFGDAIDVKSYLGYRYNLKNEDHAICLIKFKDGPISIVNVGWFSQKTKIEINLYGTLDHLTKSYGPPNKIKTVLKLLTRRALDFNIPFLEEIKHFIYCIENDETPSTSANDALKDLELITKAYKNQILMEP